MCGPKFCSMEITQQVRDYAAENGYGLDEALDAGLTEKATEFVDQGGALYPPPTK